MVDLVRSLSTQGNDHCFNGLLCDLCGPSKRIRMHSTWRSPSLSMPAMSGFEPARGILAMRADIPLLMTSGYVNPRDEDIARSIGVRAMILKPGTVEEPGRILDDLWPFPDGTSNKRSFDRADVAEVGFEDIALCNRHGLGERAGHDALARLQPPVVTMQ